MYTCFVILPTLDIEQKLWSLGKTYVCGVDEVGRGAFVGSVVVAAVVFAPNSQIPDGIRDSKLLSAKRREVLSERIKAVALDWVISESSVEMINRLGIGKATQIAFFNCVKKLKQKADFILIDAFFIDNIDHSIQKPIISGDKTCMSIAAASIIAKVYRDQLMNELSSKYPEYDLAQNKGYGTQKHQEAIAKYGLSKLHRTSFNLDKFL